MTPCNFVHYYIYAGPYQFIPKIFYFYKFFQKNKIYTEIQNTFYFFLLYYSFLIAANGLSFIALSAGRKPEIMPINTAKPSAAKASQGGI